MYGVTFWQSMNLSELRFLAVLLVPHPDKNVLSLPNTSEAPSDAGTAL